jgi:hypothetical protein
MARPAPAAEAPQISPIPAPGDRLARLGPAAFAGLTFLAHAACGGRYGPFRDELYFIVCGARLAAGYVDQPPGVAVVARLAHALSGSWVPGLRLLPWLATAGTVYLAGRLAARLGAGGAGATLAAAATFACLVLRGAAHLLTMNAFDPLLVGGLAFLLVRLADGEDPRLWVAAGALAGLAVLFKYTSAVIAVLFLLGFAASSARRALATPWVLLGAAAGLLTVLPNLVWQAAHGFPFLELVHNQVAYKNALTTPLQLLGGLAFEANPGNAPLWVGGLAWLLAARAARPARFAGLGALAYLALLAAGHGKPYYAAPVLPVLLAAGATGAAALLRRPAALHAYAGVLAASAVVFLPMAIPILPERVFLRYQEAMGMRRPGLERLDLGVLPQLYADMHGWRELAAAVAQVYARLPPEEQRTAAVFGKNYGTTAAVDVLGPEYGLPPGLGVSGHNSYWLWGVPAGRGDPLIVIGGAIDECSGSYAEATIGAQLPHDPLVMPYEDAHTLWICRGLREPMTRLPEQVRHFE